MSILARLSLHNRMLVALATVAIIAFGLLATFALRLELIPSLQLPMTVTTTTYPGASPEIVDREVTQPLEQAITGVDGVDATTSTSQNSISVIQAEFDYGTDLDEAVQQLEQAVSRLSSDLPSGAEADTFAGSFDDSPVVLLAASSDLDEREFVQRLEQVAVPELSGIEGVRDVEVTGARDEQLTIDLDEEALAAAGLTPNDVSAALEANGVGVPGGALTADDRTLPVDVGSDFESTADLEDLQIMPSAAPSAGGEAPPTDTEPPTEGDAAATPQPVRLGDVASVDLGLADVSSITRTDGQASIGLSITKEPAGNTVGISTDTEAAIEDITESIGNGVAFTTVFDQAPFIEESIEGLTTEGLLGLAFAIVVILVFLLSLRSTIVTAVSIPLSLLVAMIGIYVADYSLNILTLAALTISIGRVVDDSIVVLENIKRHLGYGESKRHAILTATKEVAGAITAATLTTAGVFLPIAIVGGQAGELFRPFSVTVAIALMASLVVALTVIPVLAYWFMRPVSTTPEEQERVHQEALAKERRNPLQRAYVPVIEWAIKRKLVTIFIGLAVFAGTIALTPMLQTNFLDAAGQNAATITQQLPPGTSLQRTDEAVRQVEAILAEDADVESYQVTIGNGGFGGFGGGSGTNEATFSITTNAEADQTVLVDDLRDRVEELTDAGDLTVAAGDSGGPGSSDVEVIVSAGDADTLAEATTMVYDTVREVPNTTNVTNNLADDQPSIRVSPDRDEAAAYGLTDAQIGIAVRAAFEGQSAQPIRLDGQEREVVLRTADSPTSIDEISALPLATPTGEVITVGDVAEVSEVVEPAELSRTDGEQTGSVTATPDDSDVGALTTDLTERLDELNLPDGASYEIGGVSAEQQEAFAQLGVALLAAIAIVFLVMVATFRSLVQPLILLISIPFAATGALAALLITDTALGVPALIGVLMLVGIVVTNAIVLIDLINQYREQGMPLREAVIEGGRQRLRPILMTALATIFALFPMSLGLTGGGVFVSQPLAIVVIGGLISSTLLTLIFVPTLYSMVEGFKERRAARRAESGRRGSRRARTGEAGAVPGGDEGHASDDGGRRPRPGLPPGPVAPAPDAEPQPEAAPVVVATVTDRPEAASSTGPAAEPAVNGSADEVTRVQVVQVEVVVRTPGSGRHDANGHG